MRAPTTIGNCRHYVTIQQATETQGTDGSVVQTWGTFANAYAEIICLNGSEDFIAQGLSASLIYKITIRYLFGVVAKMRILWIDHGIDRIFEIETVRNLDERGRWTVMNCEKAI